MANRLGVLQQTISIHLQKMPELAKLVNTDLSKGFTVSQVAEKHGWTWHTSTGYETHIFMGFPLDVHILNNGYEIFGVFCF